MTRRRWLQLAGAVALAVLLGVGVMVSGVLPLSAAEGHWALTEWFLQVTKRRTIAAKAVLIEPPPLEDPVLVLRGAGHYELGCRPCHGTGSEPPPRTLTEMMPPPPFLPDRLPRLGPGELFWVVKNGIKMTGMPGWPSPRRDDEVWAMVAFLLRLSELAPDEYRRLALNEEWTPPRHPAAQPGAQLGAEPAPAVDAARPLAALTGDPPAEVVETCRRCHGEDGQGRGVGAFPRLAGQRPEYLLAQLRAFSAGTRHSGTMETVASALAADTMVELAAYYAALPAGRQAGVVAADVPSTAVAAETVRVEHDEPGAAAAMLRPDPGALVRGRAIALEGIPERRVPSCVDCHGPTGHRRNPHYPWLAGQYPEYLVLQLELFRARQRGGSRFAHLMYPVADRLRPEEIRDVAFYFASLPPASEAP